MKNQDRFGIDHLNRELRAARKLLAGMRLGSRSIVSARNAVKALRSRLSRAKSERGRVQWGKRVLDRECDLARQRIIRKSTLTGGTEISLTFDCPDPPELHRKRDNSNRVPYNIDY